MPSSNKRSINLKRNIIASFCIKGISILISLLIVPLTLNYVKSDIYGIWLTISSMALWLQFFDIGLTSGLKNKLTEAISLGNLENGKSLVSTTYFMMIILFIPLCIILQFVIPLINWCVILNINDNYNDDLIQSLRILAFCFCLQMILNVISSISSSYQKVALANSFPVIGNICSLLAIFILTKTTDPSLTKLSLAIGLMPLFTLFIATFILFRTTFSGIRPSILAIRKKNIRKIFNLGSKFFIIQVQIIVLFQSSNFLISYISSPEYVTFYNIANRYLSVTMMAFNICLTPLWPAFTDAYICKDFNWMKQLYKKMKKLYFLSACILLFMICVSKIVYGLWIGPNTNVPYTMTIIVGICMIILNWKSLHESLINGIGTIKLQSILSLLGMFLHLPLSLLLGKWFKAEGVIISICLINLIYGIIFTAQLNKILKNRATGIWLK